MRQESLEDPENISALRARAEKRVSEEEAIGINLLFNEAKELVHELRVSQIELEMQNEALRASQIALEALQSKYADLYNSSPIALVVLDQEGCIEDPNFMFVSMLGVERYKLLKWTLTTFISYESQDPYHLFYRALVNTQQPQECEIVLMSMSRTLVYVRLYGAPMSQDTTQTHYRIAFVDLTSQKHVEAQKLELAKQHERIEELVRLLESK